MTLALVFVTDSETGLRRDGVRVHIEKGYRDWSWNVTVPTMARTSSSCMCINAGTAPTQAKARAAAAAAIAVYDIQKKKRRSLYETARLACNAMPGRDPSPPKGGGE